MDGTTANNTASPSNLTDLITNTTTSTHLSHDRCLDWKDVQHVLYQLANLGFAVAFLIPGTFTSHGPLLRGLVCCGCLFVLLWGGTVTCHMDMVAWNVAFLIINSAHLLYAAYDACPVQLPGVLELMYHKLFLPLDVPRAIFKQLADLGKVWELHQGATFAEEGASYSGEYLTVLLAGHLQVLYHGLWLHYIEAGSFVNSIEYESVQGSQAGSYQVSYHAIEDCTLLTWKKEQLLGHLAAFPEQKALFHLLLGRDIHLKLTLVQEALMRDHRYLQFVKEKKRRLYPQMDRLQRGHHNDTGEEMMMQNGVSIAVSPSVPVMPSSISSSKLLSKKASSTETVVDTVIDLSSTQRGGKSLQNESCEITGESSCKSCSLKEEPQLFHKTSFETSL